MATRSNVGATLTDGEVETLFRRLAEAYPGRDLRPESAKTAKDPFRSCVSCLLSAQSLNSNTRKATTALFKLARTPRTILKLSDEAIIEAIKPAGLYNNKAKSLRRLCAALVEEHGGKVPETREGLMALPGIGRKCADIVLHFAFHKPVCAVDTHVHRVANRVGLAHGNTNEATAKALEPRIPDWAMWDAHVRLISWGKRVCRSQRPQCEGCLARDMCVSLRRQGGERLETSPAR
ncbi:MAG: endonuclease III domain-containing protein [Rhodothalassiaceae bacterium]